MVSVSVAGVLLLFALSGVMLLLRSYAAAAVISVIQASSLAAFIASKVATYQLASFMSCSMINVITELYFFFFKCTVNIFSGFVIYRFSRLQQTITTATRVNYPLCQCCFHLQGLWVWPLFLYRYAVKNY